MTDPARPAPLPRLTSLSPGAGCACKLGMADLDEVLAGLPIQLPPDVVVGSGDDAAVWAVDGGQQIVLTTDFFTPIVDDPNLWGRIAATNAGSDVFAMGGRPVVALNIVGWPTDRPAGELEQVLQGAAQAAAEGGWVVVGGHTITSPVPFFGQAVVGTCAAPPLTMASGREGDVLLLTAPIGTGIVTTAAIRSAPQDVLPGGSLQVAFDAAVAVMTTHNSHAAAAARASGVLAATDVTGFGLLGHAHRLALASGLAVEFDAGAVPMLPDVASLVAAGRVPGGTLRNLQALRDRGALVTDLDDDVLAVLADAQTSGGLLLACPPAAVDELRRELQAGGIVAPVVGRLVSGPPGRVAVA